MCEPSHPNHCLPLPHLPTPPFCKHHRSPVQDRSKRGATWGRSAAGPCRSRSRTPPLRWRLGRCRGLLTQTRAATSSSVWHECVKELVGESGKKPRWADVAWTGGGAEGGHLNCSAHRALTQKVASHSPFQTRRRLTLSSRLSFEHTYSSI